MARIQITGASTSRASGEWRKCTTYTVSVEETGLPSRAVTVNRRYKDFFALHSALTEVPGYMYPKMPKKGEMQKFLAKHFKSHQEERRRGLEEYLTALVDSVDKSSDVPALAQFLGLEFPESSVKGIFNYINPTAEFGLPLPVFMLPKRDIEGDNGIVEVAFGESEVVDGVEVTIVFQDEDRPNRVEDAVYDVIRKPLFGRSEDIETITFVRNKDSRNFESILFKGTYSGDQNWSCKVPSHDTATIPLTDFERDSNGRTIVWVNVWNHLFGQKNNNPDMEMISVDEYPSTKGTRAVVDSRYHGMISSVA